MDQFLRKSAESSEESREGLLTSTVFSDEGAGSGCGRRHQKRFSTCNIASWLVSLLLLVLLVSREISRSQTCDSTGYWASTEFQPAARDLPATLKQVRFKSALKFNESHQTYIPPTKPLYVGPPNAEIDASWEAVLGPDNLFVTAEEERTLEGDLYRDNEYDLYIAGMSVFHDIHCLNFIRKYIYLDYYPELKNTGTPNHLDHCIDALRQSLMCTGDMTLIPIRWSENRGAPLHDFDNVHTCRDYDALRAWTMDRNAYTEGLREKNAERLLSTGK